MFEFLPGWLKALIGSALILFLLIYGIKLTSKGKSSKSPSNAVDNKKES